MLTPVLAKLLILQDRDSKRLSLEAQIRSVPGDVASVEAKIASEKGAIDEARGELRSLEARRKLLESEIGVAQERLARYKHQQMQVRKNEEYQALGHEIETTQAAIGALEEQEIELLYAIDAARERFLEAEAVLKRNIHGHEQRIQMLRERQSNLTAEREAMLRAVDEARAPLEEAVLRVYDRIAGRQMPVCVPIRAGKCGGCHLKVSGEVESAVRNRHETKLVHCDQCGRLVWWDES